MSSPARPAMVVAALAATILAVTWWKSSTGDAPGNGVPADDQPRTDQPQAPAGSRIDPGAVRQIPAPIHPEDIEARRIANQQSVQEVVDAGRTMLETRYRNERVDTSWAPVKERTLERLSTSSMISDVDAGPDAFKATCRSTVCEIEASFPSRSAADDWITLYSMGVGTEMPNVSVRQSVQADGTVVLQLYGFARP